MAPPRLSNGFRPLPVAVSKGHLQIIKIDHVRLSKQAGPCYMDVMQQALQGAPKRSQLMFADRKQTMCKKSN